MKKITVRTQLLILSLLILSGIIFLLFRIFKTNDIKENREAFALLQKVAQENHIPVPLKDKLESPRIPESENAKEIYLKIFNLLQTSPPDPDFYFDSSQLSPKLHTAVNPKLQQMLLPLKPVLELLPKAILKEKTVFPINYEDKFLVNFDHLKPLRTCTEILLNQSLLKFQQKNYLESLQNIFLALKLIRALEEDRLEVSGLVALAFQKFSLDIIASLIPSMPYEKNLEFLIIQEIQRFNAKEAYLKGLIGEREIGIQFFEDLKQMKISKKEAFKQLISPSSSFRYNIKVAWWNVYKDSTYYYKYQTYLIQQLNKPDLEFDPAFENCFERSQIESEAPLASMLIIPLSAVWVRYQRHQAFVNCILLFLRSRQFYHEKGQEASSVAELQDYFREIPLDPITGHLLQYKKRPESLTIYSVGINKIDDGGRINSQDDEKSMDLGFHFDLKKY